MTRLLTLTIASLSLLLGSAFAHAEPSKWLPACYVEGLVASTVTTTKLSTEESSTAFSSRGLGGSVGSGCDFLIAPRLAFGILGRITLPEFDSMTSNGLVEPDSAFGWQGGARLGYIVNKGVMVYAIAGWSGSEMKLFDETLKTNGVFWGAGLDLALAPSVLLTVEWNQSQLGDWKEFGTSVSPVADTIRLGVKYQFFNSLINSN